MRSVANASEVARGRELLWDFFEGTNMGVSRHDAETWIKNGPNSYGIFWGFGSGHSRFMWHIRTLPRLLQMFELVWGSSDLLTSFEGFSMFPPERVEASWELGEAWFHTDQNAASRPGLQTVQSFTSLYDQDESTGGFVVVPRSWRRHQAVTRRIYKASPRTPPEQQFLMVPADDPVLAKAQRPHLVRVRAGDAILWDSRTVHCSTPSLRNRKPAAANEASAASAASEASIGSADLAEPPARVVAYACFAPRRRAPDHVLLARQRALFAQRTCTHWPFEMSCLEPPHAAGQVASDPLTRASGLVKNLVGYTDAQIRGWLSGGASARATGPFDSPRAVQVAPHAPLVEGQAAPDVDGVERAGHGRTRMRHHLPSKMRSRRRQREQRGVRSR